MSNQLILVLNCGSSSLKGAVIDRKNGKVLLSCLGERLGTPEAIITFSKDGKKCQAPLAGRNCHAGAVGMLLKELEKHGLHDRIKAIGHRIAHGGEKYHESVLIDQDVLDELKACIPLAPLHNPANISGILAAQEHFPGLPNVGGDFEATAVVGEFGIRAILIFCSTFHRLARCSCRRGRSGSCTRRGRCRRNGCP